MRGWDAAQSYSGARLPTLPMWRGFRLKDPFFAATPLFLVDQ